MAKPNRTETETEKKRTDKTETEKTRNFVAFGRIYRIRAQRGPRRGPLAVPPLLGQNSTINTSYSMHIFFRTMNEVYSVML